MSKIKCQSATCGFPQLAFWFSLALSHATLPLTHQAPVTLALVPSTDGTDPVAEGSLHMLIPFSGMFSSPLSLANFHWLPVQLKMLQHQGNSLD